MIQKNGSEIHGCERTRFSVPENQLVALLLARRHESKTGITVLDSRGGASSLSYAQLYKKSAQLCAGLQSAGLQPGERLVLQLSDGLDVIVAFWGCMLAGVIPVPLNTAPFYDRPNSQTERLQSAVVRFSCRAVLASPPLVAALTALLHAPESKHCSVLSFADCCADSFTTDDPDSELHNPDFHTPVFHTPLPDDPAAMFLTSGSTGAAKGVVQTHAAMLAMADATIQMNGFTASDVTLNWMSLDHAGSLVFLGVMPLALSANQVHVPIDYVLKEPTRWLDLIQTWRASITWAPNFVFSLLLDRQQQMMARAWDLSCMRFMVNAGEAVVSATARRFIALLQQFGLPDDALRPAFGMVETCSGITWSRGFNLQNTSDADTFVSLGPVIPGAAIKIVDASGAIVEQGVEGRLLVKGPSVFCGYEGEDALNASMLVDGWLVTGDLAFIKAGELYVTGREKDMVIINGNNHYCHEIESVVAKFPAVASDCVAAVGVTASGDNTESLVIFYAVAAQGSTGAINKHLEKTIRAEVARLTGISPKALIVLSPDAFPRTEIGKIKRSQLKRRYETGEFGSQADKGSAAAQRMAIHNAADTDNDKTLFAAITAIWQRALGLDLIGPDETFFELGGSSLLAIQVQHELELLLGRDVSMVELFDTPTIRSMTAHFSGRSAGFEKTEAEHVPDNRRRDASSGDIAVIGIACRFPGAHGPEAFWRVLEDGVETLSFFGPAEAIAAGVPPERAHDPAQVNAAPVLDDVEGCDLDFWKYAKREAELLDPQQRVFLETAWEAFEDAGYVPGAALGKVGVYASAATNTYLQNNVYANRNWVNNNGGDLLTVNSVPGFNVMVANDKDYLPTRVSYKLDLTGPSMSIQTACSSTLVAVHEATRALHDGECDLALAGGCALMLPQHAGHYYEEGMINSPDGHCRAYDRDAKGTIFGSGSGAVVLKRLEQALADGDAIYAVIKGSAVVNDGGQKMGFTAPSMLGEYRAISKAIDNAGIDADSIGFVEGHGTGTPIGDPIEVQALTKAFRHNTARNSFCALGSVKTNIGHMGIASGIAGFIKTVLALHHKTLPATLHFNEPNPAIDFAKTPFYVSNRTQPWQAGSSPRRAGVNSLGIGGTNVHVILEEAPARAAEPDADDNSSSAHVLPLSAGSEAALQEQLAALSDCVTRHGDVRIADLAFTWQHGRLAMSRRRPLVVADREDLLSQLAACQRADTSEASSRPAHTAGKTHVLFMFTGQGCQYVGMGKALYHAWPVFRDALDACSDLFRPYRDVLIRDLILADAGDTHAENLLNQTQYTQPALFCIQVALVQLYRQFGIRPDSIVGHSIGEVAGVWAAGGLSLSDAVVLVEARSRLMQSVTRPGAMASVKADISTVRQHLPAVAAGCEIAGHNAPFETTITGDADAVATACDVLRQHDIRVTPLNVSHAFHSRHMEVVQPALADAISDLAFNRLQLPVFCNVDASVLEHERRGADYWTTQLRAPVQFMPALQQALIAAGHDCCVEIVEIGPAAILCGLGRALEAELTEHNTPSQWPAALQWIPSLRKGQQDTHVLSSALAVLFANGHNIDWSGSGARSGRRIHLPAYRWQRQRCWIDPDPVRSNAGLGVVMSDPLRKPPLVLPRLGQQIYTVEYSLAAVPVLAEHRVFDVVVPPAALYVSQLLYAASDFSGQANVVLSDIQFVSPMHLDDTVPGQGNRTVQIQFASGANASSIELSSQPDTMRLSANPAAEAGDIQIHVAAELLADMPAPALTMNMNALRERCRQPVETGTIEAHMAAMDVQLGASFLDFVSIHRGQNEALALLDVPTSSAATVAQSIPAGLLDCHWQTILAALPALPAATIVPARIDTLVCYTQQLPEQVWAHAVIHQQSPELVVATVTLLSAAGEVLLESRGIEFRAVAAETFRHVRAAPHAGEQTTMFARHWHDLDEASAASAMLPASVWLAGPDADVSRLAAQLSSLGITPVTLTESTDITTSDNDRLIYIDCIADDAGVDVGADASAALNRVLARSGSDLSALRQIIVVTALTGSADPALSALASADRSALMAQTVAAAHELPDCCMLAVEMDQQQQSVQTLSRLLATSLPSGLRVQIRDGQVQSLKADVLHAPTEEIKFSAHKVQVITGGLGGLGLLTAQWMFRRGAQKFLLAGRSAPSKQAEAAISALVEQGAYVEICQCDVGDYKQVVALAEKAGQLAPVQTLIHAAGLRRDGLISSLQDADFSLLRQTKAVAAENLHNAFQALHPELTLYYSSIAGWLGGAGQSNYCAANAALDSLASEYTRAGDATFSVAWGPWAQTGMMAALNKSHLARIKHTGYGFLQADSAFSLLGRYLAAPHGSNIAILAADVTRLAELPAAAAFFPAVMPQRAPSDAAARSELAAGLRTSAPRAGAQASVRSTVPALADALLAMDDNRAREKLQDYLTQLVTDMTSPGSKDRIDLDAGFLDMGIDSLAALELRKKLESALGIKLKSTLILDFPNIAVMAQELVLQTQRAHGSHAAHTGTSQTGKPDRSELLRQLANEIDFQESV